jgi:peptidoglycan/xylan/chitin deacetylase (PgdA/CDA1 family)
MTPVGDPAGHVPDASLTGVAHRRGAIDRRRFLIGAGSAATAAMAWSATRLGALGSEPIVKPASVDAYGRRGSSLQATPTLPPPYRWQPGDFLMNVAIDGDRRMMALTFDDGPSPYNTRSVLRTLASRGVKATFFWVGVNVRSWPDIAREVVSEGHEIGNHSVYHTPYQAYALSRQIGPNQDIIRSETGVTPIVNRAPGLTRGYDILDQCRDFGLYECHTHMATYDWLSPRHSASALYDEFVRYHRNGAFALYHDGGGRRPTPEALPYIIDYALGSGYELVTATELTTYGDPVPGRMSYSQRFDSSDVGAVPQSETPEGEYVDVCGYDARLTLEQRLEDPTVTRAERSRIVEVLAEMDEGEANDLT